MCYNGVCVQYFIECLPHPRTVKAVPIMITIDLQQETDADIIVNSTGYVLGKLYIPSNTKGIVNSTTQ